MKFNAARMNDRGAKMLASAILLKAAEDYFNVCDEPTSCSDSITEKYKYDRNPPIPALLTKGMIELFFRSQLFDALSDISPEIFREGIKRLKKSGKKFPNASTIEDHKKSKAGKLPHLYNSGKTRPRMEHSKF